MLTRILTSVGLACFVYFYAIVLMLLAAVAFYILWFLGMFIIVAPLSVLFDTEVFESAADWLYYSGGHAWLWAFDWLTFPLRWTIGQFFDQREPQL